MERLDSGATDLIDGCARSFFAAIPSLFITGQVSPRERSAVPFTNVQQSGFQEAKIVDVVKPITKYAVLVRTVGELRDELADSYEIATSGRKSPVLIDVPMDLQQAETDVVFRGPAAPDPGHVFGQTPCKPDQICYMKAEIERRTRLVRFMPQVGHVDGLSRTIAQCKAAQTRLLVS